MADSITRKCASCAVPKPQADYSKKQWFKRKDGQSKCRSCVDQINKQRRGKKRLGPNLSAGSNAKKHRKANEKELERQQRRMEWERQQKKHVEDDAPKIQYRLNNPEAPCHPDMQRLWKHSKSMTVTSGRICFGLNHEVREGAKEAAMTFEDALFYYGDLNAAPSPHNTVAKNGTWVAYKLIDRDTTYDAYYPGGRTDDNRIAGWFICHASMGDPVAEVCNMLYNTFNDENGGNYRNWYHIVDGQVVGGSNNTHPFHADLGYVLIPRYAMGYNMPAGTTEEEEDAIRKKGLCVVDYAMAQRGESSWSENGICNLFTYGDFDIGRLRYNKNGECVALLLTGSAAQFQTIHFSTEGSAPLGKEFEDWDKEDAESGRCI